MRHALLKLSLCSLIATATFGSALAADNYPTRPVRMIVPFGPGGASDYVGRILQPRMSQLLGQQLVIDNRAGASGNIGAEAAARATPDGYTILLGNVGTMAINPTIFPKIPMRPLRDLIPVTQVVDVPGALVINPKVPATSVSQFIAYLKANPNKLNFGSPGPSSANCIVMDGFLLKTGTKMVNVPYKGGAGPAMVGLLGNEVQASFVTFSSAVNFAKQGRIRMLGVVAPKRVPVMPDVPTMAEQGFKDMTVGSWQGIFVPKGTPQAIVAKLFQITTETMKDPDVVKKLGAGGVDVVVSKSPAAFRQFVAAETAAYAHVIKVAHIPTM